MLKGHTYKSHRRQRTAALETNGRAVVFAAAFALVLAWNLSAANPPACDSGNGGLELPPGFCALVVADGIGPARHMAVAPNGDIYVGLQANGRKGGVMALRDANGDGRFEIKQKIGQDSVTGVALRNGYLYLAKFHSVERYKMTPDELTPPGPPEIVVSGLPGVEEHGDKGIAFDGQGSLYVNIGAPSNACQPKNRRARVPGQDPCQLLEKQGGIWKFSEDKLGQKQEDGTRVATGLRQMPAIAWHDGALYIAMNNRDQLDTLWPGLFTAKENAERPAEPLYRAETGANFGWPYCFFDYGEKKLLMNPEYGGDGKKADRCAGFTPPIASFPAHWAPVDLMFYSGAQFPEHYKNGIFIAFHGSWNRAPMPQDGYNVTFQPFVDGHPSGSFEVFASGFAGATPPMNPDKAAARADGVAEAPDGSLYISESQHGKIWRVIYRGRK
ncbi:MAG: PQQ-dependent sugar dehydrogenase [Acidobacteriia bacterium]|nr:PQQ-dependent sugar dehydrogenase [Terriglobia bacterium]